MRLQLAICCLQAIEFVQMQQDDELWDLLIALALSQAPLTGRLLIHGQIIWHAPNAASRLPSYARANS